MPGLSRGRYHNAKRAAVIELKMDPEMITSRHAAEKAEGARG